MGRDETARGRSRLRALALALVLPGLLPLSLAAAADAAPPADPARSWGLDALGVPAAHAAGHAGQGVAVAVIETGRFDADHPLFAHRVARCADLTGAPRACHDPSDAGAAHATHVAGIVHQVAPDATLHLLTLAGTADARPVQLRKALQMAAAGADGVPGTADDARVAVVSLSVAAANLGGAPLNGVALARLYPLHVPPALTVVAAAGNTGGVLPGTVVYPAASHEVVSVSALGAVGGARDRVSQYGAEGLPDEDPATREAGQVDLVAPGTDVVSSLPGGAYGPLTGTSMAAPHVAGLAALHLSAHPDATPAQVRAALLCGARDVAWKGRTSAPGHDPATGWGLPEALRVVEEGPCHAPLPPTTLPEASP